MKIFKVASIVLSAVFALSLASFAEKPTVPADNTKVAKKVDTVLAAKTPAPAAAKAEQESKEKTVDYKYGQVIDLDALDGKTLIALFPASSKTINIVKETVTFYIAYSNYSYKFDISLKDNKQLKVIVTPLPQKEKLIPTAEARFVLGEDSLDLALRAVTMDDVNDGMGWGEVYKIANVN